MKSFLVSVIGLFSSQLVCAQVAKTSQEIKVVANNITTTVQFWNDNTVHVLKYAGVVKPNVSSLVVLNQNGMSPKTKLLQTSTNYKFSSAKLSVVIDKKTGNVQFLDKVGNWITEEECASDFFQKVDDSITHVTQRFRLSSDEAIYGLGQHQNGKLNQRNTSILLKQSNMEITVPFFQSSKGYGIYWDNNSSTIYTEKDNVLSLFSESGKAVDYYFVYGKNADAVINGYRRLTGAVPMLPLWSYGYIQSRERYQSQDEIVDVVKKYRQLQVPLDAVVQDWQYWGEDNHNWNAVQFDNPRFSHPKKMIDDIHNMNAKVLISVWPSFGEKTPIYKELQKNKMLYPFDSYPTDGGTKVYDAFNPEARSIYWNYMNKNIFSLGMDGWWLDATEPEQLGSLQANDTFHTSLVRNTNTHFGNYRNYTNAFPLASVEGVYKHQRSVMDTKRVFILTRSAFAGQQRSASVVWSGDINSSWTTLKAQIPTALNYTLSGMPYWNSDIGGFFSYVHYPKGIQDLAYQELYIRWLQFGTFTSMMRSHGTNTPREIYQFGKAGDVAFDIIRNYIGLRYKLAPYIYSTAWDISSSNGSFVRSLVMDYPQDKQLQDLGTEYLFGKSLLVVPVTDSIFSKDVKGFDTSSTVATKVYLPEGNWFDFHTNEKIRGRQWITQNCNLATIPLFVKEGSIIPMANEAQFSSIKNFKELNINVYPGKDATFELYEDEGDNYNYEKGKYAIIKFVWNENKKTFTIENRSGNYNGMNANKQLNIYLKGANKKQTMQYAGKKLQVQF